jgi:protease IV
VQLRIGIFMFLFFLPSFLFGNNVHASTSDIFPAVSASLQDDATTIWTNPANFAFAPASTRAYGIQLAPDYQQFGYARQLGILGTGISYKDEATLGSWWSIRSALALRIDDRLSFSTTSTWHSIETLDDNMITWGAGLGWRPFKWLGFGATIENIGMDLEEYEITEEVRMSSGLSLLQNRLQVGVDYMSPLNDLTNIMGEVQYTIKGRPMNGLSVQFHGRGNDEFGMGISVGYGSGAVGGYSTFGPNNSYTIHGNSGINDTSLIARGRRVAYFEIDNPYPYQSQSSFLSPSTETYFSLLNRLHKAAMDPAIKGIYIHLTDSYFSLAQIEEIRKEFSNARTRGKQVIVYLEGYPGNGEYYLASAADRIYLHPAGSLEFVGLASERIYFKGLLDLVGVEPEYVKRSEYKSAPEQYTENGGTDASHEQSKALLDDIFQHLVSEVSSERSLPEQTLVSLIDDGPYSAKQAVKKGLVDALYYKDEMEDVLDEHFGALHRSEEFYGFQDPDGWSTSSEIAIIPITGVIMPGESQEPGLLGGETSAGSKTIVAQIDEAADDSSIKAIVIRVDSPGGSAFASDQIWRSVEQAKREKPIIVSMGNVAASGGYYVAAGADAIFAEETTITGSIGVYSGKFNASKLIEMVGVNVESETRGRNANLYSSFQHWDENQKEKMEEMVEDTYVQFKQVVANGRQLSPDEVEEIARGRVWSGKSAKEIGLVDINGGLFDAIDYAKELAGINTANVSLIQYSGTNESSLYKINVQAHKLLEQTSPLSNEIDFLQSLEQENLWMVTPNLYKIH